ncbi:MAG: PH domain-containing protein [Chloroflexi bacterium]|nr:PH domain-containing protein [Chloroflexota bacterium]
MPDSSWRVRASSGGALGIAVVAVLGLASTASVLFAIRQPVGFVMFLALLVALVCGGLGLTVAVLTFGYFRLRYRFGPDALIVTWLGRREAVPYDRVDGIFAGPRLGQAMRVRGLNWPGYHIGIGRTRAMGLVRYFVTTGDLSEITLIVTPEATFALSPADAAGFRRELIRRVEQSEDAVTSPEAQSAVPEQAPQHAPSALRDLALPFFFLVSLGVLALTVLYISLRWSGLPDVLATQVARDGPTIAWGQREDIFMLPGMGAAILLANLGIGLAIYARERVAARMLWGTTVVVQVLVLVATARVLH